VGAIASAALAALWPKNKRDVWPTIEKRAKELIAKMIDEDNLNKLKLELDGLKNVVAELADYEPGTERSRRQFQIVLNFFENKRPLFCDPRNVAGKMPFFVEMASLHLAFLKARCDDPASISKHPVGAEELNKWKNHLSETIQSYYAYASKGWGEVQKIRSDSITFEPIWAGTFVHDRFLPEEKTYKYFTTPGKLDRDHFWCVASRKLVLENQWNLAFFEKYMVPAYGWLALDLLKAPSRWYEHAPALDCWLLGLQEKETDPNRFKPFPLHDKAGGHAWWSDQDYSVWEYGRLEWLDVAYKDTIAGISAQFADKEAIQSRLTEPTPPRRDYGDPSGGGFRADHLNARLAVPPGRYVEKIRARVDYGLIGLQLIFDDGSMSPDIQTDASRANKGIEQIAAVTDYGVRSLTIGERCSALKVGLVPKNQITV
jgi:hypothetical protein